MNNILLVGVQNQIKIEKEVREEKEKALHAAKRQLSLAVSPISAGELSLSLSNCPALSLTL